MIEFISQISDKYPWVIRTKRYNHTMITFNLSIWDCNPSKNMMIFNIIIMTYPYITSR